MKFKRSLGLMSCVFMMAYASISGCGSGNSSTESSDTLTVNSLGSLPSVDEMLSVAASSSSSFSAKPSMSLSTMRSNVVSGTPPVLSDINESNADAYFWNGLVADINLYVSSSGAQGSDPSDPEVQNNFWEGEGSCRMASNVSQSLGNIAQAGTSSCYMSHAPDVLGTESILSGTVSSPSAVLDQEESNKLVKVQVSDPQQGEQNIFIRVFGSSSSEGSAGYAADLWFCNPNGGSTPENFEQIRVNNSTGSMTFLSAGSHEGEATGVVQFAGNISVNSAGEVVFDPNAAQTANVYFSGSFGTFKGYMSVEGSVLNTKNININEYQGNSYTNEVFTISNISSNTSGDALFLEAGFGFQGTNQDAHYGGTEYQDSRYVAVNSGTLYDLVNNYDFSGDSFFTSAIDEATSLTSGVANYSCSESPDVVVAMDMSSAGMQSVQALCEVDWETSNFCDSSSIQAARQAIFTAQQQN